MQYLEEAFGALNPIDTPAVNMSRHIHARSLDRSLRNTEDTLAFFQRRVAADRQLVMDLLDAGGMPDHARVWAEYWHVTLRDYIAHARGLGTVLSNAVESSFDDAAAASEALQNRTRHA